MGSASSPGDYLNSYLLLAMIIGCGSGNMFYNPAINLPSFTSFCVYRCREIFLSVSNPVQLQFACGAVSGFHALVSSGTTSNQIKNERTCCRYPLAPLLEIFWPLPRWIAVGALAPGRQAFQPEHLHGYLPRPLPVFPTIGDARFHQLYPITLSISQRLPILSLDSVARGDVFAFQEFLPTTILTHQGRSSLNKVLTNKYFSIILTPGSLLRIIQGRLRVTSSLCSDSANQLLSRAGP